MAIQYCSNSAQFALKGALKLYPFNTDVLLAEVKNYAAQPAASVLLLRAAMRLKPDFTTCYSGGPAILLRIASKRI